MTEQERIELTGMRSEMNEGFREVRELIEQRRQEDTLAHGAIYATIEKQRSSEDSRLRSVERVAYAATAFGAVGLAFGVEILRRLHFTLG